jgi:hypothetical protein
MTRSAGTGAENAPALDRPWRRPGALRYGLRRVGGILRPPVAILPPPDSVVVRRDVPVTTADGTVLRVNVHLPIGDGPFPVLMSTHPYGKDAVPRRRRRGGYRIPAQYHMMRQTVPVRMSALTGWEAPDPAWWTARGFAVVNADLRGAGTSDGVGSLLSDQEGEDIRDLVEWAGAQNWSTGAVGLIGVSYLGLSQWKAAALQPPSLRAIVPWEGFTDAYRDLFRPGGIAEVGFVRIWSTTIRRARLRYSLAAASKNRPLRDQWWRGLAPDLGRITVPALICGSFSDNNMHSRGSFRAFERISSTDKHVYTHRTGKWATFYSDEALAVQLAFLDRHLRPAVDGGAVPADGGSDAGWAADRAPGSAPVRLEVRERRNVVSDVRSEAGWPLPSTRWTALYLTDDGLSAKPPAGSGSIAFRTRSRGVRFGWTLPADTELIGPMALRLFVSVHGADDLHLFAGVEKWDGTGYVPFEGSYGFGRDRVNTGWLVASLRRLDEDETRTFDPVPALNRREPLAAGDIVQADIALGPSSTLFRRGDRLRVVVAGRWLWPRNPLTGQFPAAYRPGPAAIGRLHWGPDRQARLLVPVVPRTPPARTG